MIVSIFDSPIFSKIEHVTWKDIKQSLLDLKFKKYIRNWFEKASSEQIHQVYSFLKDNDDDSKELISELPLISFNGHYRSFNEVVNNSFYIFIDNTYEGIREILVKMGYCCSDENISNEGSLIKVDNYYDKKICGRILSAKEHQYNQLTVEERVSLFKCIYSIALRYQKNSSGYLDSIRKWKIFKSRDGHYQNLSLLACY